MQSFIPLVIAAAALSTYLVVRWGRPATPPVRWGLAFLLLVALALTLPWRGVETTALQRVNLLIALATALFLSLWHLRARFAHQRTTRLAVLSLLASLALLNYTNYLSFHGYGQRAFVHLHDVAHYYLGSKYYPELGHQNLYSAVLRAEAELYDNHFRAIEARDLESGRRVHIRELLVKSDPVKAAFSDQRWREFRQDVELFRSRLTAEQWATFLLDHGFNPTPLWALLGGSLANRVPGGSEPGLLALALLDPVLLALAFAILVRTFGLETGLLVVIFFSVSFGANFAWTGGAFLRFPWLCALLVGSSALQAGRSRLAGVLLALSTALRVFPAFLLVPLAAKAVGLARRRESFPRRYVHLFTSFATTLTLLFGLTGLIPHRDGRLRGPWLDFAGNMERHLELLSPNRVGLTEILALDWTGRRDSVTLEELEALEERRSRIHRALLFLVFLPCLVWVTWTASRRRDLAAVALGLPLVFVGLNLAGYYYVVLLVLVLANRHAPGRLAAIFAAEAAPYVFQLFAERQALLFAYRGVFLALLFVLLELDRCGARLERAPARLPGGRDLHE